MSFPDGPVLQLALLLLTLPWACASPGEVPELPSRFPETTPPGYEESVAARTEAALPQVSYSASSPHFPELIWETNVDGEKSMDVDRIAGWIRQLESLDGDRAVVCRTNAGDVFGDCQFPVGTVPYAPEPEETPKP